jgi:hypothetical protein
MVSKKTHFKPPKKKININKEIIENIKDKERRMKEKIVQSKVKNKKGVE